MKFLLALTVLASATGAFANDRFIKCWETAQGNRGEPAYVFKVKHGSTGFEEGYRYLSLVHPFHIPQLQEYNGCLKPGNNLPMDNPSYAKFCETDGQRVNGLVPIEVEKGPWDETVYCESEIRRFFNAESF